MILLTLVQNIVLLIALAATYQVLEFRLKEDTLQFQALSGLLFGVVGTLGMMAPLTLLPGVIIDGCSVILSVAGLFGGPLVGLIAAGMCSAYRLWLGGAGAWVGVAASLESALVGVVYYYLRQRGGGRGSAWSYLGFGFLVHLIMLAFMLGLPGGAGPKVISQIGLPVMALFPFATMLVCLLFQDYETRQADRRELMQSEERFRHISTTISDIAYSCSGLKDGNFSLDWMTGATSRITGYRVNEIIERGCWRFLVCEEDVALFERYVTGLLPGASAFCELRLRPKHGEPVWIASYAECVRDPVQPERLHLYGGLVDISERKQAEEELQRRADEMTALREIMLDLTSQQELSSLLDLIVKRAAHLLDTDSGGMYLCDPGRREVACVVSYNTLNDYTGTVLKYGEGAAGVAAQTGEALIIDDYSLWPGRAKVFEAEQPFSAVLAMPMIWHEQVLGVIHVLHHEAGRRFSLRERDLLTLFANQAVVAVQNTNLIEALRQNEQRLRAALDSTPFPIALVDNQDNVIDYWSRSARELFGHTAPTASEWYQLAYPDAEYRREAIERWKPFIEKARLSDQAINTGEYRVTCKDGSARICELYAAFSSDRLIVTFNDITERKQVEQALIETNELLSMFIKNSPIQAYIKAVKPGESRVLKASDNFQDMVGIPASEMAGKSMSDLFPPDFAAKITADDWAVVTGGEAIHLDEDLNNRSYATIKFPIFQKGNTLLAGYTIDITERKRNQQKLANALQEKEILLRELYHRTKNNMQVILSMLSIESAKSRNKEIKTSFKEVANRIQAMALVHEKLYQSQNLSNINAQEYLQDLVELLLKSHRLNADQIALRYEIEPVELLIDIAIPLGLVVTELVSNTLKYAFPNLQNGEIGLRLIKTGEQIELTYVDNGVGLPRDFDFRAQKTYGLRSIFALVEHQLRGEITFSTAQPGIACQARFSVVHYAPRVET